MYSLTIHFGPNAVAWSFLFKDKEKAIETFRTIQDSHNNKCAIDLKDDYGQRALLMSTEIHGILIEDTELGQEARILRGLEQAKGQARATQRAKTDPELRSLMQSQGPGVLTPFANGGFRPQ